MATLEDKLMGEKLHYYCSSSEDEDEPLVKNDDQAPGGAAPNPGPGNRTGPKGVIEDWRRFKQLETEKREESERERLALAKKLSMTCRSEREDQEVEKELEKLEIDNDDDEFFKEYMKKRMEEIQLSVITRKQFGGQIFQLKSGEEFLHCVDDPELREVQVIIHIWEAGHPGCQAIDGCLQIIAKEYTQAKFCRIQASSAPLSSRFKAAGVPAILVYRSGELISSFVRITDTLGDDFYASDLESFLVENGVLTDAKSLPSIIRGPAIVANDSDSDE